MCPVTRNRGNAGASRTQKSELWVKAPKTRALGDSSEERNGREKKRNPIRGRKHNGLHGWEKAGDNDLKGKD